MTSRDIRANLRVGADVTGALASLERLRDRAEGIGRRLNNLSGGSLGRAGAGVRGVGRRGGGVGSILIGGAGLGAGAELAEQLLERLFELFEDTPVLEKFINTMDRLLQAAAPIAGVLIDSLTPAFDALLPVIPPLVTALAPLIQLLGTNLAFSIQVLTPLLIPLINGFTTVALGVQRIVTGILQRVVDFLNSIEIFGQGFDIQLPQFTRLEDITQQLEDAARRRDGDDPDDPDINVVVEAPVIVDAVTIRQVTRRETTRRREFGS